MAKKRQQQSKRSLSSNITKRRIILFGTMAAIIAGIGFVGYRSMIPANGTAPVFGLANNHFIKATHENSGYMFVSQSSSKVKNIRVGTGGGSSINPTYEFKKGSLESFHVIGGDYQTHSKHNFNIDEFNVHTRDLGNFETQTVTIVPDKAGTFEYYCTIHPEMRGNIIVDE
jgi:hypothetical protein